MRSRHKWRKFTLRAAVLIDRTTCGAGQPRKVRAGHQCGHSWLSPWWTAGRSSSWTVHQCTSAYNHGQCSDDSGPAEGPDQEHVFYGGLLPLLCTAMNWRRRGSEPMV